MIVLPGPDGFKGIAPRITPRLLAQAQAQNALDCDLRTGALKAMLGTRAEWTPTKQGTVNTIHRFGVSAIQEVFGGISAISSALPVHIQTNAAHGLVTGQRVNITGTDIGLDDHTYTATVEDTTNLTIDAPTGVHVSNAGYLNLGEDFTGNAVGLTGTICARIRPGSLTQGQYIYLAGSLSYGFGFWIQYISGAMYLRVKGTGLAGGATVLDAQSSVAIASNLDYVTVGASWNVSTGVVSMMIDDTDASPSSPTTAMFSIDYNRPSHLIGSDGASGLAGILDIGFLYFDNSSMLDLTQSANRQQLMALMDVNAAPDVILFMLGDTTTFKTNKGSGGKTFSVTGSVTPSFTSPFGTAAQGAWNLLNGYWLHWTDTEAPDHVEATRGAVNNDASEMTFFTGHGKPKLTYSPVAVTGGDEYPMNVYDLGVPAPTAAPVVNVSGAGSGETTSHSMAYTFVATYGPIQMEGPPSPGSAAVDVQDGQQIDLSSLETAPPAGWEATNITHKRVYRSEAPTDATQGSRFYFVAEIPLANDTYSDLMGAFGDEIETTLWDPPPADMHSIVKLPNGSLAGLSGNAVCVSEPVAPHAWPTDYQKRLTLESDGVGLAVIGTSVVVTTQTKPYILTGSDPASMTLRKLEDEQACVSNRSMVSAGHLGVMYASPDGLILVTNVARNVLDPWMTREQWQALRPESVHAYYQNGAYVFFYDDGVTQGGYVFDPAEGSAGLVPLSIYATAGYVDPLTDTLFLLVNGDIVRWDSGSPITYTWRSKVFESAMPVKMTAAQIMADDYADVTMRYYADGVLAHTEVVASRTPFRMRADGLAYTHEVEIEGTSTVLNAVLGENVADLARA